MHYAVQPRGRLEGTIRYHIQPRVSTFTVRAFAIGLLSAFAHSPTITIPDLDGEILLNPDAMEQSSVRIVIHAESLRVTSDLNDKDKQEINRKMRVEVLETDSYPEILYECSKVSASKTGEGQFRADLNGELTLHGVTRGQALSARVWLNGKNLRATGDFAVHLSDYEIKPVTAAGGTIKLKDELKLTFDVSAGEQV